MSIFHLIFYGTNLALFDLPFCLTSQQIASSVAVCLGEVYLFLQGKNDQNVSLAQFVHGETKHDQM